MPRKEKEDLRSPEEREAALKAFELQMRQAVMECDSLDDNEDKQLDFYEFSRLMREREVGVHSEYALRQRFEAMDADGSGTIDLTEFITFALRDAFVRSAANINDLFKEWDEDGNGMVDMEEFRQVVRHFGFTADDKAIDAVFKNLSINTMIPTVTVGLLSGCSILLG